MTVYNENDSLELPWSEETKSKADSLKNQINILQQKEQSVIDSVKTITAQVDSLMKVDTKTLPDTGNAEFMKNWTLKWNEYNPDARVPINERYLSNKRSLENIYKKIILEKKSRYEK